MSETAFQVVLPIVKDSDCERAWKMSIDEASRICAGHNLGGMGICQVGVDLITVAWLTQNSKFCNPDCI